MFGYPGPRPTPPPEKPAFWQLDCPERPGPLLTHRHDPDCNPEGYHPDTSERHQAVQCCYCGHTAESWAKRAIEALADPDSLPLAIQPPGCTFPHESRAKATPLIGDDGLEWPQCPFCHQFIEPKLAVGEPIGKSDGIGRGWVSPRTQARWAAIRYRLRDEIEALTEVQS